MTFDLKTATPATSITDTSFVFGAAGGASDTAPEPITALVMWSYFQGKADARYYTETELDALFAAHEAAANPHPGYLTPAEGAAAYDALGASAAATATAAAALVAHEAAANPHPGYLTPAEGAAAYSPLGHGHTAAEISDATVPGRSMLQAASAAAQRTLLGLGTAALSAVGDFAAAVHTHAATSISDSTAAGRAMLTAATVAAQTALLDTFTSGAKGLAPLSGGGTTNFLRADGTWAAPAGGGSPAGAGTEIQYRDGAAFGAMAGTVWDNTNRSLAITGATVTTSKPVFDFSQVWNAGGVAFTGLKGYFTDTASAAASLFLDFGVGGTSKFRVRKDGQLTIQGATANDLTTFQGGASASITHMSNALGAHATIAFDGTGSGGPFVIKSGSGGSFVWQSTGRSDAGVTDLGIFRAAAGVLNVTDGSTGGGTLRHTPRRPAAITADTNNYASGGVSYNQFWSATGTFNVTGLGIGQGDGQVHAVVNVGSNAITLKHQDAGSTAANRVLNSTGADIVLAANQAADLTYDGTQARWLAFKRA